MEHRRIVANKFAESFCKFISHCENKLLKLSIILLMLLKKLYVIKFQKQYIHIQNEIENR